MKHFLLFLIILISFLSKEIYSQQYLLEKKISIEIKNTRISDAVNQLNKKSGNILSYKNDILQINKRVTISAKNETVRSILEKILYDTEIRFFQIGDQIILKKKRKDQSEVQENEKLPALLKSNNIIKEGIELCYIPMQGKIIQRNKLLSPNLNISVDSLENIAECPYCDPLHREPDFSETASIKTKGKHSLLFSPGIKSNSSMSVISNNSKVSSDGGFTATFSYGYMLSKSWQLIFTTGVFVAEATVIDTTVNAKAIIPLLIGFRNYANFIRLPDYMKLYAGASIGAYIAAGAQVTTTNSENISSTEDLGSETKLGINANFGIDFFVFRWLKLGPNFAFHLFGDYNKIFDQSKNFSGAEMSFNMGIVF